LSAPRLYLLDLALLPVAGLAGVVQHVIWPGWRALLAAFERTRPVQSLRRVLARSSPLLALPLFLVPEIAGHAGTVVAAVLLAQGHLMAASLVYALSRLLALLMLLAIWEACAPVLLRLRWFAWTHDLVLRLRHRLRLRLAWRRRQLQRVFPAHPGSWGELLAIRFQLLRMRLQSALLK